MGLFLFFLRDSFLRHEIVQLLNAGILRQVDPLSIVEHKVRVVARDELDGALILVNATLALNESLDGLVLVQLSSTACLNQARPGRCRFLLRAREREEEEYKCRKTRHGRRSAQACSQ